MCVCVVLESESTASCIQGKGSSTQQTKLFSIFFVFWDSLPKFPRLVLNL